MTLESKLLPVLTRRGLLGLAGAGALSSLAGCLAPAAWLENAPPPHAPYDVADDQVLLDDIEHRTFRFFWETTDARTGLAPDRWPSKSFASIAAVGFALTAYPIGVERGWITRAQARERVLNTMRFFHDAPQGPSGKGIAGYKGFFYHFLDMQSGERFDRCELSTVDTALLLGGMLFCRDWFDGIDAQEKEIRQLADAIYARVDWRWAQTRGPSISHGWSPEAGFITSDWKGYNEAMLVYLLALGAPTHAVNSDAWDAWTSTYDRDSWGTDHGQTYLRFPPLFGHQFTHCWVDFRGLKDSYMRNKGIDYFENSRRATYAQRAYAIANPEGWKDYGKDIWGVTACDGPADVNRFFNGKMRKFISYAGRGMGGAQTYDDGTIAPYASGSSIAFAPEIVVPALRAMKQRYGAEVYGRYGFFSFNPSFTYDDVKQTHGRVVPGLGWVDIDQLGIEQGPLVAMLGNYRSEIVWKTTRRSEWLQRGLRRAGFSGGWLDAR